MTRDAEFYGVQLKQGDMVYALVAGANRDPRAYERADEFVLDRKRNNHMGFANGPHRCLGMHLARRELQIAVQEWLRVIPDFRIATDEELTRARRRGDDDADAAAARVGDGVVRLTVDGKGCMGHGRCYLLAPDLLTDDDEGFVTIRDQTIDVPADQVEAAEEAAGTCPEQAITPDPVTARAAVVGAGPSGFYAAEHLLRQGVAVDLFDALPTPYGLVRAGVAPDHPKIKSVTRIYEKTAQHADFRFFGGVELGADVTPAEDLLERYHAVVYAVGTRADNRLGIPGDDRPGLRRRHRVRRLVQRPPALRGRGVRPVAVSAPS